ncbi:DUF2017 domain-containing protein [Cellulomonas wangsupingiae]|uniref:DUF2017 domain-containing protein n=1 Tax=Cellulomonas wangsupingiae TaxID=2968085 RepID=A0ABY5K9F4_9CELL|nr:DUF2017 domain-containing protein [Cellulomonas wangsupingiae]MCC2334644.1 DUF2017 domain-containing protein [Cellulomonas wangsupingiae]MCM0638636.1 DUF2017 domain-containing protein [Cellulomonas wangsupingiae]UUI66393.1 DUF2017 domain-containing protein [Cellulomonas wangsupingiae]
MHAFRRQKGRYVARLDAGERAVVASVVADVAELLGAGRFEDAPAPGPATSAGPGAPDGWTVRTAPVPPPQDPAVRRLLPDASRDDPEVAREFRRLTEDDLRTRKIARLRHLWTLLVDGEPGWPEHALVVAPQAADDVAATLTDLRLVLGERLDLRTDADSEALYDGLGDDDEDDVRAYLASVYGALSWLQESLLAVMLAAPEGPGRSRGRSDG